MSVDNSSITDSYLVELEGTYGPQDATKLFGRDDEMYELISAFEKVTTRHSSEIVIIHGLCGSGKTALVDILREPVCNSGGYFCAGKFFQNSECQEPHSALMAAFSDLCEQVVQSDDFRDRKPEIMAALGSDGRFLEKSITSLSPFLDESAAEGAADTRNEVALTRFNVACTSFLRAMSSREHPIVLFIDDVQWMDGGSRILLEVLLCENELENVLIVLAYRDEEAETVHGVLTDAIQKRATDIHINNLSPDDVFLMVSTAVFSEHPDKTRELSDLIANRTLVNPLYILSFLRTVEKEGMLFFDPGSASWSFNVDQIQREVPVSDTLADMLSRKIDRLQSGVQETLKVGSLLGFRFGENILREVTCALSRGMSQDDRGEAKSTCLSNSTLSMSLTMAESERLVEKTKNGGYQFVHDKIQATFQAMYTQDEKERLHKVIGETYLAWKEAESVYHAAVHLNQASPLLVDEKDRISLANLNLQAAKICKKKSAFDGAVSLLLNGLELININDKWGDDNFDLSFEMTELLAKMYLVVGKFDACKAMVKMALHQAKSAEMKIESLLIGIECRMANNEMVETIVAANEALPVLGVHMPRKVGVRHMLGKLLTMQWKIRRISDEDIVNLAPMEDKMLSVAVRVLVNVSMYCLLQEEKEQGMYCTLLAVELTLQHGISPYSPSALVTFGMVQLSLGNYDRAYGLGIVAMKIVEKVRCRGAESPAIAMRHSALTHWKEPVSVTREPFLEAISSGFETGDMIYGIYAAAYCNGVRIMLGENLRNLEEDYLRPVYSRMCSMRGQEGMIMWTQPSIQFVLNMRSDANWRDLIDLNGEFMNEGRYLEKAFSMSNRPLNILCWQYKAMLAFYFGFYGKSASIYEDLADISPKIAAFSITTMSQQFYASMTNFIRYSETGNRKNLKSARDYKKKLQAIQSVGSPSAASLLSLVQAEELASAHSRDATTIMAAYDKAIDVMATETWVHLEAMANERAGFAVAELGRLEETENYFERALQLYKYDWGSIAKYEWLRKKSTLCLNGLRRSVTTASRIPDGVTGMELACTSLN